MELQQLLHFLNLKALPFVLLVLLVGLVGLRLVRRFLDELAERFADSRLTLKKVNALLRFFVYFALALVVLTNLLELEREALLAVAGTVGVALGFAFKDLFASLMAGVVLLLDEPFQVGDRVHFEGNYGEIQEIGLRSVRLVTLDDNLVTIPNSNFLTDAVASANAGELSCMVVIPFYIAAAENFDRARLLIAEATATSRYVYLDKAIVTLVNDSFLGERFVTVITVKAYVLDARYEKAFESDVTERVKRALKKAGIRTPDQQYRDLDLNRGSESVEPAPSGA
jgi:small-conductance mechanosensitive channel